MQDIGSTVLYCCLPYSVLVTGDDHLFALAYNFPFSVIKAQKWSLMPLFVVYIIISMFRDSLMLNFYLCTNTKNNEQLNLSSTNL